MGVFVVIKARFVATSNDKILFGFVEMEVLLPAVRVLGRVTAHPPLVFTRYETTGPKFGVI